VGWVSLFSTVAGLLYGARVNVTNLGLVTLYLFLFLAALALLIWLFKRRSDRAVRAEF